MNFPMTLGCYRGDSCYSCKGDGTRCTSKRVVYQGRCIKCKESGVAANYIGETARQLGERVEEHLRKVDLYNKDSFIVQHWMDQHPLDATHPEFEFSVLSTHKDSLSRQIKEAIVIGKKGNLNKKSEFGLNEIIRMAPSEYTWDLAEKDKKQKLNEREHQLRLQNFIYA